MPNLPFNDVLALMSVCLPFVLSGAAYLYQHLLNRLPQNRQAQLQSVANMVVKGVEQRANGGESSETKKAQAVAALSNIAKDMGWKWVSPTLIDLAIEAVVHAMNQNQTPASQPQAVSVPAV